MKRIVDWVSSHQKTFKYLFWFWLICLFAFSSIPQLPVPELEIISGVRTDYILHLLQYFILASLFVFWKKLTSLKTVSLLLIWLFGSVIAAIDEVHQIWIPDRSFNLVDLLFNSIGIFFGLLLTNLLLINSTKQESN